MLKEKIIKICEYIIGGGILAIIFFIPLIFDFAGLSYNIVDLYKVIVFRVILAFMLLAFLAKVFITGRLSYRGSAKIFLFSLILLLSFFVSSLFSVQPNQSFWGDFTRQQGFYNFFNYLLFFVLLILNLKDFKQIKRIIFAVISSASLTAVYALIQYFNLDPAPWNESAAAMGRVFSTLGQPNFFGHYLILVLPIGLYALIFMAKRPLTRFFLGLAVLAQLACLIFTYSRAAWLGFFGGTIFLLLAWLVYKRRKKTAFALVGLLLIGLMAIIGLNVIKPAGQAGQSHLYEVTFINRLKSMVDFNGGSGKMRLYYLRSAVQEIKRESLGRLLVGFGPETLAGVLLKYYQPDWGVYEAINGHPDRVHNWLFDQFLALGIFGLAANLAFFIYFIYKAAVFLQARKKFGPEAWLLIFLFSSLAAYFINNFFSFSLFTVLVYLYLILALVWFIINHEEKVKEIDIKLTNFSKLLIWLSLLAVSAVFILTNNINQIRAEIYYIKAINSMELPDCRSVVKNMKKTLSLSPNSVYYQENYLFLMLNCFSSIKDWSVREQLLYNMSDYIESIGDRKSYGILQNIASIYSIFGFYFDKSYYAEADKLFNNLIADYPYFTTAYENFNKEKIWREDYTGAIEIYKRALEILPPADNPDLDAFHRAKIVSIAVRLNEGLGQVYFKMKNYDLALGYYKNGLALDPYRATLYKDIADIYYIQGRLDQAIAWNKRGLMLNPGDYNWPLALSLLYRDKKDLTKAKDYLNQALKLAPENAELKKYEQELDK